MTSLPVADPSIVIDDSASSIPGVDLSHVFIEVITSIINWFRYIIVYFDSIYIFSNVSLLDFHIAISIFGIIFAVFFSVIRANSSYNFVDDDLRRSARQHIRDNARKSKSNKGGS